jgi:hypothetical protein
LEIPHWEERAWGGVELELNSVGGIEAGIRFVTRAKYAISFLNPVQGSSPARPMPMFRVAATIRVSSKGSIVWSSWPPLVAVEMESEVVFVSFEGLEAVEESGGVSEVIVRCVFPQLA